MVRIASHLCPPILMEQVQIFLPSVRNPILSSLLQTESYFLPSSQLSAPISSPLLFCSSVFMRSSHFGMLLLFQFSVLAVLTVIKSEVSLSLQNVREGREKKRQKKIIVQVNKVEEEARNCVRKRNRMSCNVELGKRAKTRT